jgi:hypothetical protein
VNRAEFVVALTAAAASPSSERITADIAIQRDSSALLAPFSVTIAVRNRTTASVSLDFPTADLYRIDVRRDDVTVWSTATGHKPLLIARRVEAAPGVTRLASQIVDGTTDDRRAYAPGRYIVHVAMLGTTLSTTVDEPIAFDAPISIAQARSVTGGTVVTVAGVPSVEDGVGTLHDATGSLRLSRPLGSHAAGSYIVRGSLDAVRDEVEFTVGRFAPAYDNLIDARPQPTL